jgi:hypothetical protein
VAFRLNLFFQTALPRAQPPQDPAQRAKLPGAIAKAQRHAGHSREASTDFSEACTAYLRIMSRIGANAFEHFRRAALRSAPSSSRCQRDIMTKGRLDKKQRLDDQLRKKRLQGAPARAAAAKKPPRAVFPIATKTSVGRIAPAMPEPLPPAHYPAKRVAIGKRQVAGGGA